MTRNGRILLALPILATMALAPAVANAQYYNRGYGGYRGGYGYGHGYGHRGFGAGPFLGGAVLGLGLGAVIAGAPRYYAPPPPVVYAPPPAYYPAPVYAAPAYPPPGYYAPGYYVR